MSDTPTDPFLEHLRERQQQLEGVIAAATIRLEEINGLLATLGDGRTRVRRRLKVDGSTPMAPEPPGDAA